MGSGVHISNILPGCTLVQRHTLSIKILADSWALLAKPKSQEVGAGLRVPPRGQLVLMELQPSEPNCSLVPGQEPSLTLQLIAKLRQRVDTQEMCIEQGRFGRVRRHCEMGLGTASLSRLTMCTVFTESSRVPWPVLSAWDTRVELI